MIPLVSDLATQTERPASWNVMAAMGPFGFFLRRSMTSRQNLQLHGERGVSIRTAKVSLPSFAPLNSPLSPMKTFSLLRFLLVAAALLTAPVLAAEQPPILNSTGEQLENPKIKSFDGATFEVIHSGGVSRIPWESMPAIYRVGYNYDPERGAKAEAHRLQQATRDMQQTQRRENSIIKDQLGAQKKLGSASTQVGSSANGDSARRVERTIPMQTPTHLSQLGGPNVVMAVQQINPLEVQYRFRRGNWRTVPLKAGAGDQLTFLFEDGAGCKTYFLDRLSRNQNDAILVFERKSAPTPRANASN